MAYVGWLIPEDERDRLLTLFKPRYPDVIAHHITLKFGVPEGYPIPEETHGIIIGIAHNDDMGVEALVVEINGTSERSDGSTYHITWSLDPDLGAKPVMSNTLLKNQGFVPVDPVKIDIVPQFFQS